MSTETRLPRLVLALSAVAAWVATAPAAGAHPGHTLGGAWDGLLHPLFGVDHLLAMVAAGLLAVTLDRDVRIPLGFIAAMAAGGAVGLAGVSSPLVEWAVAATVVALGCAVIAGAAVGRNAALALVAFAGLVHGQAHGLEAPAAARPVLYVAGFLAATSALIFAGWFAGRLVVERATWRVTAGACVTGAGVGLLVGLA